MDIQNNNKNRFGISTLLLGLSCLITSNLAGAAFEENFQQGFGAGSLSGQKGWTSGFGAQPHPSAQVLQADGRMVIASDADSRSLLPVGPLAHGLRGRIILVFDVQATSESSNAGVGVGTFDPTRAGSGQAAHVGLQNGSWMVREEVLGETSQARDYSGSTINAIIGHWYRVRSEWDLAQGKASLAVKNLTLGESEFTQLFFDNEQQLGLAPLGLQNHPMGLARSMDGLYIRLRDGRIDSISISTNSPGNSPVSSSQVGNSAIHSPVVSNGDYSMPGEVRRGDILMRSIRPWPRHPRTDLDTLATAREFGVNRVVWIYENQLDFNQRAREMGIGIGTTMQQNAREFWIDDLPRNEVLDLVARFTIRNINNEQVIRQHRMRFGGDHLVSHFEPDQTNPEWIEFYADYLVYLYGLGIDTLHRDDPAATFFAPRSGGSFTDSAVAYFRNYLQENFSASELRELGVDDVTSFNVRSHFRDLGAPADHTLWAWRGSPLMSVYMDAMLQADRDFYLKLREIVYERTGKVIPWSLNASGPIFEYEAAFDFRIGEFQSHLNQPQSLLIKSEHARKAGKMQALVSMVDRNWETNPNFIPDVRRHIGTAYGMGMIPMVPWCMYMHNAPRFYGSLEDFGDLYHFVAENRKYFDDYETTSTAGIDQIARLYTWLPNKELIHLEGDSSQRVWVNSDNVFAIVRSNPSSQVKVIHLVDWNESPEPIEVTMNLKSITGSENSKLTFLRPNQEPVTLASYQGETVTLPPATPWGILVIEPIKEAGETAIAAPQIQQPTRTVTARGSNILFSPVTDGSIIKARLVPSGDPGSAESFVEVSPEVGLRIDADAILEAYALNHRTGKQSEKINVRLQVFDDFSPAPTQDTTSVHTVDLSERFTAVSGEMKANASFHGPGMMLMGKEVSRGFSTQGDVRLRANVESDWEFFSVRVGIDDLEDRRPCARFQVYFDNVLAYETPIINPSKRQLVDSQRRIFDIYLAIPEGTRIIELRSVRGGFFEEQNNFIWAYPSALIN